MDNKTIKEVEDIEKNENQKKQITFFIKNESKKILDEYCRQNEMSVSSYIRLLILNDLKNKK